MALAAAIGALVVAAEFSGTLIHRTTSMSHRIAALNALTRRFRREIASRERELSRAQKGALAGERLRRILLAPDLQTVKLEPGDTARGASGILAISRSENAAVLEATGLAPSAGDSVYRLWWIGRKGAAAASGTEFTAAADGKAMAEAKLPAAVAMPRSIEVTVEPKAGADRPSGPVALKGRLGP
jgi:Anti-sigma-K factor rskA, C-terminal